MPANKGSNCNNNNNSNCCDFSFVDETGKTKEKHKNQKRLALMNIHKSKLRKQLQNSKLLENYFEWNNGSSNSNQTSNENNNVLPQQQQHCKNKRLQIVPHIYQYSLSNFVKQPLITKKQHNAVDTSIQQQQHKQFHINNYCNRTITSNSYNNCAPTKSPLQRKEEEKNMKRILISEEFGLKLDLEDFIQSLKEYGLH
ncbi:hypothetical protein ABK040_006246 [Willaertia magna]